MKMRRVHTAVLIAQCGLGGGACTADPPTPMDSGREPPPGGDAALFEDAHFVPVVERAGGLQFGRLGLVSDAVATVDGDLCIAGVTGPDWIDHEPYDAFVACFGPRGRTRSRSWSCAEPSSGATRLAARPNGDLFVLLDEGCDGIERSQRLERLDRGLATRASTTIATTSGSGPSLPGIAADDQHVIVTGALRGAGHVGEVEIDGPLVVVLSAEELEVVRVVGSPAGEGSRDDAAVSFVALRDDGLALLFGRDFAGGTFAPAGGSFARTMRVPDGRLEPAAFDGAWDQQYAAAWHPDGRAVLAGAESTRTLQVAIGDAVHPLETGDAGTPHVAFRGDELLVARPFLDRIRIADRTLRADGVGGGFMTGVDTSTAIPSWAIDLPEGYRDYLVDVMTDGTVGVVGRDPTDPRTPTVVVAFFYRR